MMTISPSASFALRSSQDICLGAPPTLEQLKELLNLGGLVAALVLTMVAPLPFAYGGEDYVGAIASKGGNVTDPNNMRGVEDYQYFIDCYTQSFAFLISALLGFVFLLAAGGSTSFRGPDGKPCEAMFRNWWSIGKWSFIYSLLSLMVGVIQGIFAHVALLALMLPHRGRKIGSNVIDVGATHAERREAATEGKCPSSFCRAPFHSAAFHNF